MCKQMIIDSAIKKMIAMELLKYKGGVHSVMVIVVGNGHGDTSSNPGQD